MFVSAFLSIIGLGFLVWVLFALAVYALPSFVGVTVGIFVYDTDRASWLHWSRGCSLPSSPIS